MLARATALETELLSSYTGLIQTERHRLGLSYYQQQRMIMVCKGLVEKTRSNMICAYMIIAYGLLQVTGQTQVIDLWIDIIARQASASSEHACPILRALTQPDRMKNGVILRPHWPRQ